MSLFVCVYVYTYTNTRRYIYACLRVCVCVCVCVHKHISTYTQRTYIYVVYPAHLMMHVSHRQGHGEQQRRHRDSPSSTVYGRSIYDHGIYTITDTSHDACVAQAGPRRATKSSQRQSDLSMIMVVLSLLTHLMMHVSHKMTHASWDEGLLKLDVLYTHTYIYTSYVCLYWYVYVNTHTCRTSRTTESKKVVTETVLPLALAAGSRGAAVIDAERSRQARRHVQAPENLENGLQTLVTLCE